MARGRETDLGRGVRGGVGLDGSLGGPKPLRLQNPDAPVFEAEAGLGGKREAMARGALWDTVGHVGRDGSSGGSDCSDAGSPDAVAA